MSITIGFISPSLIDETEVKSLILELGGAWNDAPTVNCGILTKNDSNIYCNLPYRPERDYEPEELQELEEYLGAPPRTAFGIVLGHGPDSKELALEFCDILVKRWGGVLNNEEMSPLPANEMIWKDGRNSRSFNDDWF